MDKKQIIKYFNNNRLDIQKARANFFAPYSCFSSYVQCRIFKDDGLNPVFTYLGTFDNNNNFFQIISEPIIFRLALRVYSDYKKNTKSLTNKAKARLALMKKTDEIWENYCQIRQKKLLRQVLLKYYSKLNNNLSAWWGYSAVVGEDKGIIIDLDIIPAFAKRQKISASTARDIINILAHPAKMSVLNKERADFLKICLYIFKNKKADFKKDEKLQNILNSYIKKYFWAKTDFYQTRKVTPELLSKEAALEVKGKNIKQIKSDIEIIKSNFIKIEKEKKKLLKELKLSAQDKKDLAFAKLVISWQDERKEEMMKLFYYLFSLIEDAAEYMKINYENLAACSPEEIREILISGKNIIKKKEEMFMVFARNKKPVYFKGREAKKLLAAALATQAKGEIKGMVASRGNKNIYTGIAKIIFNPSKQQFNKGEILVTSMTRIEFVPLMRRAKAIITDEGGIACYAAIVSRELGIPCVIGTKNATKALHDGDLVEVDAYKGVVKILK